MRTLGTIMLLLTLRLQWQRSTRVSRVTLYMTLHTNVTKLAPCVQLRHPVLNISPSIVVHAIGGFSVKEYLSEPFNTQKERQPRLSVETSMPKL